ncbi:MULTISPECIES: hypothetical protein [Aeromicrobium]|uniref:hypothetical protein n=1 Tax=Aeromicrobium TaxID=2040 RepID=UPI0006FA8499|nr:MULTISPECIES: hypothetical protein [Aeromicrobium]KQX75824.1 hypothetical protein ASD10_11950 [Aeromicrobium sp. Root472D3]MBD8606372.1 hypothetical protein [Aeromicrobium sp. CFBP 8757]MCL8253076.1 hypothetical protein [Aeromicrobium fastidiosum]
MPDQQELTISLTGERAVRCPRCQSDSGLHFDEVSLIDPAGDVIPLHAEGGEGLSVVTATIGDGTQPGRRHLIVLPHWCTACGERGEIVLRQDAGHTVSQYRELPQG